MEIAERRPVDILKKPTDVQDIQESGIKNVLRRVRAHASRSFEQAMSYIGTSSVLLDKNSMAVPSPEPLIALTPVSMPENGTAKLLYDYAYKETHDDHPLRTVTQELFNRKGVIPAGVHNETESLRLSRVIETQQNGSITSQPIFDAFKQQAVDVAISKKHGSSSPVSMGRMRLRMVTKKPTFSLEA